MTRVFKLKRQGWQACGGGGQGAPRGQRMPVPKGLGPIPESLVPVAVNGVPTALTNKLGHGVVRGWEGVWACAWLL